MTDERSGPPEEVDVPARERSGADPDDRQATAGSCWADDQCGVGCGCRCDRPTPLDRPGRAASDASAPSEGLRAKSFPEPWRYAGGEITTERFEAIVVDPESRVVTE